MVFVIQDEQLVRQLQDIADQEARSVEDVLKSLLAEYSSEHATEAAGREVAEDVQRVRRKAYAEARRYWQETGNTERLKLTDAELDEQFWLFDGEGIPRLKSEQDAVELPEGSLYALGQEAAKVRISFNETDEDVDYDEILRTEYADYLWRRMQGDYGDADAGG